MTKVDVFLLRFYLPLLLGLLLFLLGFLVKFSKTGTDTPLRVRVSLLSLGVEFPIPLALQRRWIGMASFFGASAAFLFLAASTDFSSYFPSDLTMDVFFDPPGIEEGLNRFSQSELDDVGLHEAWISQVPIYDSIVRGHLADLWRESGEGNDVSFVEREHLHAQGETSFVVERVSALSYRVVQAEGYLEHSVQPPQRPVQTFRTEFSLRRSRFDHVRPGLLEVLKGRIVLRPEFNQMLRVGGALRQSVIFDHTVVGVTDIELFPLPTVGQTIYLWQPSDGITVPIAYAVYY